MIKISLCLPYEGWRIIAPINQSTGDIVNFEFESKKNQFNQLNITFTPQFSRYETVLNSKNWGVRLQTDTLDLGFVYYDATERTHGLFEAKLMSGAYLIQGEFLDIKDTYYKGLLSTFLAQLTDKAVFTPISGDYLIELTTGVQDCLTLMDDAIKYPSFTEWTDIGLVDTGGGAMKVNIAYGNYQLVEKYYEISGDKRYEPVYINDFSGIDNTEDNSIIFIDDYKISRRYERPTLLYPYVDNGTGSAPNSRTELTSINPPWLNPQFPIVERISPITGKIALYVRNPFTSSYRERVQVYVVDNTSNSENQAGSQNITTAISEELLYRRTIWYISIVNNLDTYNINPVIKKIVLAGTLAKMNFVNNTKNQDRSKRTGTIITNDKIMDNCTYNLNTIYD